MLSRVDFGTSPDVLVGLSTGDDAGVFRLRDDLAVVNTVDFFTPVVDDPFTFGQIAAANSLSDVYAMGGTPQTALNIVCWPQSGLPVEMLAQVLRGGNEKAHEAGVFVVGGHSVADEEVKYGMAVTGVIDPRRIIRNVGARPCYRPFKLRDQLLDHRVLRPPQRHFPRIRRYLQRYPA